MVNSLSFGLNVRNPRATAMCDIDIKDHLLQEARKISNTIESFVTLMIIISPFCNTRILNTLENHKKSFLPLKDLEKQEGCSVVAHERLTDSKFESLSHLSQLSDCYQNEAVSRVSLLF